MHVTPNCGTAPDFVTPAVRPSPSSDSHAEYKQVTVLFADVVRSMDIAAALGPERLREIMADSSSVGGGPAIRRHGRQVHRRRHHGAFRRASRVGGSRFSRVPAALEIQEEARQWRPRWRRGTGSTCGCGSG